MKKLENTENNLLPIFFIVMLLGIWQMVASLELVPAFILPSPIAIIEALIVNLPIMKEHILVTLGEAVMGFTIAVMLAIVIAIIMDSIPIVKEALYPLLITSQTVPIVTLAPLFALWFGYGYLPKIIIVILVCFFPVTISLLEGLASVDQELLNLLKSMGAKPIDMYKMVKLPGALQSFFSGLKISGTYSIMGAIIGEWVGGKRGLGVYMLRVKHSFATDKIFAAIVMITLMSIAVLKLISFAEKRGMPWIYQQDKSKREER